MSAPGSPQFTGRAPDPRLRGLVLRYSGYTLAPGRPTSRRELPGTAIPLVITFDNGFGIGPPGADHGPAEVFGSFLSGLQETFVRTDWPDAVRGMQIDFSPLGAHLFLGVPMHTLTGRVVALDALLGAAGTELVERLHDAPDWASRFDLLDSVVLARTGAAKSPDSGLTWAWQRIHESGGCVDVGRLAEQLSFSRQQLAGRFREAIGVPPKVMARIRRFERAAALVEAGDLPLAEIAQRCGYYDQAHFHRDFRSLAGSTPLAHRGLRRTEPPADAP